MKSEKKERLFLIDDIRGFSIIVMVLIHTNAYFMKIPLSFNLLELSQFAVAAFIFCSSYLFYLKNPVSSWNTYRDYFFKRLKRLVFPYYLFLAAYFIVLLPHEAHKLTFSYLFQNVTLTGGLDFNWLVLLFIELTLLMPLFSWLEKKARPVLYLYIAAALASAAYFLTHTPLPYYRAVMWLPWSLVVIFTMYFPRMKASKKWFWGLTVLFFGLYWASRQYVLQPFHRSLRQYDNKYPPNLYHLAYSLFGVNVLYLLSDLNLFAPLRGLIHFYSIYSYTIYFIHIIVIYILTVYLHISFTWVTFYLAVLFLSGLIQLLFNTRQKRNAAAVKQ